MSVLVTGAGGFAGQHLLRLLLERGGATVVATTLTGDPPEAGLLSEAELAAIRWVALDVTAAESVRGVVEAHAPREVYHLAGQSSVGESFADPVATWEVNATGTLRLLDALHRWGGEGARVLVVSSAEVYGAVPEAAQPIPETAPLHPITPYGASKAAAEAAALQAAAQGRLGVVVARSFNHIGPGQDTRFALPSMARQLARIRSGAAEPRLLVGNLEAWRDFLDVRDVTRAYLRLVERGASGEIYNVCGGTAYSLAEMVQALVRLSGTGARLEVDPARVRPVDIPVLRGDSSRLRALGWAPQLPLERTLEDLLQWAAGQA